MSIEKAIKQKKFNSSMHKAIVNLIYTSCWIQEKHTNLLKPFGITVQHYNILRIVKGGFPGPVSPGYIREVMIDKRGDLTRLLDKLVFMGLVKRNPCPDNRRKVDVCMTEKGLAFLARIDPIVEKLLGSEINALTDKDADILSALLDKIRR